MLSPRLMSVLFTAAAYLQNLNWEPAIIYIQRNRLLCPTEVNLLRSKPAGERWAYFRSVFFTCDRAFWSFCSLLYATGHTQIYNALSPVTAVTFPELNACIVPESQQQTGAYKYTISVNANLQTIISFEFGLAVIELLTATPEFCTLSLSQFAVLCTYLLPPQANPATEWKVLGRLGPFRNKAFGGRHRAYDEHNHEHVASLARGDVYRFMAPSNAPERPIPDHADGLVISAEPSAGGDQLLSIYRVISGVGQRLVSFQLADLADLVMQRPTLARLMELLPHLPRPTVTHQMPLISEPDQRIAMSFCLDKLAMLLKVVCERLAERDCPGCAMGLQNRIAAPLLNHIHPGYLEIIDHYLTDATTFVLSPAGREKFKLLLMCEPLNPLVSAFVMRRFLALNFSRDLLLLLVKFNGPKPVPWQQKMLMELV